MNNSEARKRDEPVLPSDSERLTAIERKVDQILSELRSPDEQEDC